MIRQNCDPAADDTLGGRISLARELTGLSMAQAARRLGVLTQTWHAWECDSAEPRINRLTTMAGILGVSPTWLLSGVGSGPLEHGLTDGAQLLRDLASTKDDVRSLHRRVQRLILGMERLNGINAGSTLDADRTAAA